jgi:hypothetical protein
MTETVIDIEQTTIESVETDSKKEASHSDLRHIVNAPDNPHISFGHPKMLAQEVVDIARKGRIEIKALCGVVFVPTRDPASVKETCDSCLAIAGMILGEDT